MVNFEELTRNLDMVTEEAIKNQKEGLELKALFDKAMSYTSTSQVDFSVFTREKIIELAGFAVKHGSEVGAAMQLNNQFIKETLLARSVKRVFGCM